MKQIGTNWSGGNKTKQNKTKQKKKKEREGGWEMTCGTKFNISPHI